MKTRLVLSLLALVPSVATAQIGTGGFRAGDVYLYATAYTGPGGSGGSGIVHVDPATGSFDLLHDIVAGAPGSQKMCYDPFRDRLLFFGGFQPNHVELYESDAAGNLNSLGFVTSSGGSRGLMSPTGDGRIYFQAPGNTNAISYLDAFDQLHVLQDATGTAPYSFPPVGIANIHRMVYVPQTNSLVFALWFLGVCAGAPSNVIEIHRLDLSPDGSQVVAEACTWYDSDPTGWDGGVVGLTHGPGAISS